MNAPSFNCRFAIAPSEVVVGGERDKQRQARRHRAGQEDYFAFGSTYKTPVIPGSRYARPGMTCTGVYPSKIRHVVVPVANSFPALSTIRPSAVPTRRP